MTPKLAIFYGGMITHGNATRAAIEAGSPVKSAHVAGARMLKNKEVKAAIEEWRKRQTLKLEITAEKVLQELAKLAYFDPGKLYYPDGSRIPVHLLDDHTRAAVAAIEDEERELVGDGEKGKVIERRQKVRMAEKGANLERLCKHLKLFGDQSFGATVETGANGLGPDSTIKIQLVRPA